MKSWVEAVKRLTTKSSSFVSMPVTPFPPRFWDEVLHLHVRGLEFDRGAALVPELLLEFGEFLLDDAEDSFAGRQDGLEPLDLVREVALLLSQLLDLQSRQLAQGHRE